MNIVQAWLAGYSGKNITICIIDDGIQHDHPELILNYVRSMPLFIFTLNVSQI